MSKLVVFPAAITELGVVVNVKSEAFAPVIVTYGDNPVKFNGSVPLLLIKNVLVAFPVVTFVDPKSVLSEVFGVVSPLIISCNIYFR